MKNLNDAIKKGKAAGANYLIVNRKIFEFISQELAKQQKIESWLVIVDKYKGLVVAVTDVKGFDFDVI